MHASPDLVILGKAALAGLLGFVVGWERESHGHAAGVRTIALITMAGAIFTGIALDSFPVVDRLVANILTGVGFLGAGMILHAQSSDPADQVRGLTSAAAIWAMTSVGIAIGLGHYLLGIGLTAFILLLLWWQFVPFLARLNPAVTRRKMAAWRASHHDDVRDVGG
jgi:putative Mg2+ transporter-C (MgtC) family protein